MVQFMNELSDKPGWSQKIFDETIVLKWKSEINCSSMTEKVFDWYIAELRYKSELFHNTGAISVYDADVVKSDTVIPLPLKHALREAVAPLENVPEYHRDWHPGSEGKVLDLVHPSLFPLIYGRSRILPDSLTNLKDCVARCGEGVTVAVPPESETGTRSRMHWMGYEHFTKNLYSDRFQWLPCEVDISGKDTKITSYINNLHPHHHKDLYSVIENIISHTIPLWNMTLTPLKSPFYGFSRISYLKCTYENDPLELPRDQWLRQAPNEDDFDYTQRLEQWSRDTRRVVQPEPGPFRPPQVFHPYEHFASGDKLKPEHTVDLRRDYGHRGLQVIVKLANIHLTPEKPTYHGGAWHVEGQLNEHICASALYYYDSANITSSRLVFRQAGNTEDVADIDYEQDQHEWMPLVFGCDPDGAPVQDIGTVDTREGRLVTFPNILQHRVQPFELEDRTRCGHRKLLALFLVDPGIRIISTANVPCQQRAWWSEDVRRRLVSELPVEVIEEVVERVEGFPIGVEEAKEMRVQLMEERREFLVSHDRQFRSHQFSLCALKMPLVFNVHCVVRWM